MKYLEMINGAKRLVEINAGLQPQEKALIVCDTENIDIARILAYVIKNVGAEYSIAIMEPRKAHGENPTEAIARAMLGVDVVFAPTKYSLSHSKAREAANAKGVRFISMPAYTEDMLKGGAIEADFLKIYERVKKLQKILTDAKRIHISTEIGTNIDLHVEGRIGNEVSGVCRTPGTWGSPPNIEVNISPIETESQGIVYVDGSIPEPEIGVIKEPVVLKITDGKIAAFEGGSQAQTLKEILTKDGNPANLVLAEFGIGLNDHASLKGSMLEDEGAYGTVHFGFGHNADQGGVNVATKHVDCVYYNASVDIDGKRIIENGKLICL